MPSILNPKTIAGAIIEKRRPNGGLETQTEEPDNIVDHSPDSNSSEDEGLTTAAHDLMSSIEAKDPTGIAAAFRAAFQILESEPHDEIDHEGEQE